MTASISQVIQTESAETLHHWKPATWEDYLAYRNLPNNDKMKLFFNNGYLLVIDTLGEEIEPATIRNLFTMLFASWLIQNPNNIFSSLGGCLIEKAPIKACIPDLVIYLGEDCPRSLQGEKQYIDLSRWRVPNLVGEIADTTLATDMDEKKHLYAELGIPEYWVIDVRGQRVFAFQLQENGEYKECDRSLALAELPISLLEQTLSRLNQETNGSAAFWFAGQIANLKASS